VSPTADGLADPPLAGLPPRFTAFVGHKEACRTLPPGATLLAASRCSGYFAPDDLDDVMARLGTVPVEAPHRILANFVRRYAQRRA
jgi:GMP synthase (glutamine-hydrolysing)